MRKWRSGSQRKLGKKKLRDGGIVAQTTVMKMTKKGPTIFIVYLTTFLNELKLLSCQGSHLLPLTKTILDGSHISLRIFSWTPRYVQFFIRFRNRHRRASIKEINAIMKLINYENGQSVWIPSSFNLNNRNKYIAQQYFNTVKPIHIWSLGTHIVYLHNEQHDPFLERQ